MVDLPLHETLSPNPGPTVFKAPSSELNVRTSEPPGNSDRFEGGMCPTWRGGERDVFLTSSGGSYQVLCIHALKCRRSESQPNQPLNITGSILEINRLYLAGCQRCNSSYLFNIVIRIPHNIYNYYIHNIWYMIVHDMTLQQDLFHTVTFQHNISYKTT